MVMPDGANDHQKLALNVKLARSLISTSSPWPPSPIVLLKVIKLEK
jgi:hypothetical protein